MFGEWVITPSVGDPTCMGTPVNDAWFSFQVPSSGSFVVKTAAGASYSTSTSAENFALYSGTCGNLKEEACNSAAGHSSIGYNSTTYPDFTPNSTVYLRVWGAGSNKDGKFNLGVFAPVANDECANAPTLTVGSTYTGIAGTTSGLTASTPSVGDPSCITAPNDAWYQFVVPTTGNVIIKTEAGASPYTSGENYELYSGTCNGLTDLNFGVCNSTGHTSTAYSLTPNATIYIRLWGAGYTTDGNFKIGVFTPLQNDECSGAISLNVGTSFSGLLQTTLGATPSSVLTPSCASDPINDLWYSAVVPASGTINIKTTNGSGSPVMYDAGIAAYTGTCGGTLNEIPNIGCSVSTTGQPAPLALTGLTPLSTIYIRVWGSGIYTAGGSFNIGAWAPAQNDECAGAIDLPVNSSLIKTAVDLSTMTGSTGVPVPGCGSSITNDAWFKVTIPSSGTAIINVTKDVVANGDSASMAIYTAAPGCVSLAAPILCNDGKTTRNKLPYIRIENKTPGDVYYIRFWSDNKTSKTFNIGAFVDSSAGFQKPSDNLNDSTQFVCNLNGFYGTSMGNPYYTVDPKEGTLMSGYTDRYNPNDAYFHLDGVNGPPSGVLFYSTTSTTSLENTSWMQFYATGTNMTFYITVKNCDNLYPNTTGYNPNSSSLGGVQIAFLRGAGLVNGVPSSFYELKNGATWMSGNIYNNTIKQQFSLTGLTLGQVYYILVDGIAGDVCDYKVELDKNTANMFSATGKNPDVVNATPGQAVTLDPSQQNPLNYVLTWTQTQSFTNVVIGTQSPSPTLSFNAPLAPGKYYCLLNAIGGIKCTGAIGLDTVWVIVSTPQINFNSGLANKICQGTVSDTYTATAANTITYTLQPPTAGTIDPAIGTVTWNAAFSGKAVITASCSDGGTNTISANDTVTVNALPAPTAGNNNPCAGTPLTLHVGAVTSGSYSWSGPSSYTNSSQNLTVTVTATADPTANGGVYTVTVTDGNNCSNTAQTTVTVLPKPTPTATNNGPVCEGGTFTLNVDVYPSYSWSGPPSYVSIIQHPTVTTDAVLANAGTYTVSVTGTNGCTNTATTVVVVNQNPTPTATANTPACVGDQLNLGVGQSTSYSWSGPATLSSATSQNPFVANITTANAGTYKVTVTDVHGCSNTSFIDVNVYQKPTPTASVTTNPLCEGSPLILNTGSYSKYSWTGPNFYSGTTQNPTVNPTASLSNAGVYTVSVTDANGCTNIASTPPVVINTLPTVSAGLTQKICQGSSANIIASGGVSYLWSPTTGLSSATIQNPIATPTSTITYTVTATDAHQCENTATIEIDVQQKPSLQVIPTEKICKGDSMVLSTGIETSSFAYKWTNGITNWQTPTITVKTSGNYLVTVSVANMQTCYSTETIVVNVVDLPTVYLDPDTALCVNHYPIVCNGLSSNETYTYEWSTGDVTPMIYAENPGTFKVTVTNSDKCSNSDDIVLTDKCEVKITIPNVFTPNGDGKNDVFKYITNDVHTIDVHVFDRWGKEVFSTSRLDEYWDGKRSGTECSAGTYYYVISYKGLRTNLETKTGCVTLVKEN